MARLKKSEKNMDVLDLSKSLGLTLLAESDYSNISDRLPTFIPTYDAILGGGIPFGRMTEMFGSAGSGKSTLAMHLTHIANEVGCYVMWIDTEGTADIDRWESMGIDMSKVFAYQGEPDGSPMTIESVGVKIMEVTKLFEARGIPILIIWDSLAQTLAKVEYEKELGDQQPGIRAKSIGQMINQVGDSVNKSTAALVIINQSRETMGGGMFVQDDSPGGRQFKHWATLRLEIKRGQQIKEKSFDILSGKAGYDVYAGHQANMKIVKSKVSTPNKSEAVPLVSSVGFNLPTITFELADRANIITTAGAWKTYITDNGEEIKAYGKDWAEYLRNPDNFDTLKEIYQKVLKKAMPDAFPALHNKNIDVTEFPLFSGMEKYYKDREKNKGKEPVKEEKAK